MRRVLGVAMICVSLTLAPATAATKVGAACPKAGKTVMVGKTKLICTKRAGKLTWQKSLTTAAAIPVPAPTVKVTATPLPAPTATVTDTPLPAPTVTVTVTPEATTPTADSTPSATPSPTPVPSPAPQPSPTPSPAVTPAPYLAPATAGLPVSACQLTEQSPARLQGGWRPLVAGFPTPVDDLHKPGVLKVALIPVEFSDLLGQPSPLKRVAGDMAMFSDWYDNVSEGRERVEWVTYDGWVRLPGLSSAFTIPRSNSSLNMPDYWKTVLFGRTALAAADPYVDFTGVDAVHFLLPSGQTIIGESIQSFPNILDGGGIQTNEGLIGSFTLAGVFFDMEPRTYWSYWAHELGHFLRIAHVGTSYDWSEMHGYELMGGQDGPYRSLDAWLRFVKGWMAADQIYCTSASDLTNETVMLVPLEERAPGIKSVMVRLSDTTLLVIDSRRRTRFASTTSTLPEGPLVYLVDATKGHGQEFLKAIHPDKTATIYVPAAPPMVDALLHPGDSITYQGIQVQMLDHGYYDTVRVSRV